MWQPLCHKQCAPVLLFVLAVAIALLMLFCLAPVLWQILTSFKVNEDIAAVPPKYFPSRATH
jgi:multiple sugar transport system permease protein